jgi:hypothetical protein
MLGIATSVCSNKSPISIISIVVSRFIGVLYPFPLSSRASAGHSNVLNKRSLLETLTTQILLITEVTDISCILRFLGESNPPYLGSLTPPI